MYMDIVFGFLEGTINVLMEKVKLLRAWAKCVQHTGGKPQWKRLFWKWKDTVEF
jgi:hypothetical protein